VVVECHPLDDGQCEGEILSQRRVVSLQAFVGGQEFGPVVMPYGDGSDGGNGSEFSCDRGVVPPEGCVGQTRSTGKVDDSGADAGWEVRPCSGRSKRTRPGVNSKW
jgi:hypothetical protein